MSRTTDHSISSVTFYQLSHFAPPFKGCLNVQNMKPVQFCTGFIFCTISLCVTTINGYLKFIHVNMLSYIVKVDKVSSDIATANYGQVSSNLAASKQQFCCSENGQVSSNNKKTVKLATILLQQKTVKLAAILLQRKTVQPTAIFSITLIMDTNYEVFFCILRLLWGNAACDPNLVSALGA